MLTCNHHVVWLRPIEGGKHQCSYCKEIVTKKDIYPKFEDLGPEFARKWEAHEKGEAPAAAAGSTAPAPQTPGA
jgi:hypothetical protein